MTREQVIESISDGNKILQGELNKMSDETIGIIKGNYDEIKALNPNTIIESVEVPGGKSLIIKFSVTVNTLPYIVNPGE